MLAVGTVAMLTCGVGQHLLDSLQGIRLLLFRWIVRQHMVACCCCDTCTPHLYLSAHSVVAGSNKSQQTVTLSPYKNRLCHRVHTTFFTSNGICLKFCHFTEDATHTLRQASWWVANGVIFARVNLKNPLTVHIVCCRLNVFDESNPSSSHV